MPDHSPRPFDSKLALVAPVGIGGMVIGMLVAAAFFAGRPHPEAPPPPTPPMPAPASPAAEPKPLAPLTRADLIDGADVAASAAAGRAQGGADAVPAPGRAFTLRIAFGCPGVPAAETAQVRAVFDPETRAVRLSATPADWTLTPLIQTLADPGKIERAEGFWLPRPWALSEGCPAPVDGAPPATPTPPSASTLGFATLQQGDDSRVGARRERAYAFVRRLAADDLATAGHSYNLVLEGRLAAFPDGRALRCWVESPNHRPICLYAVALDRVAFEDADSQTVLTDWR